MDEEFDELVKSGRLEVERKAGRMEDGDGANLRLITSSLPAASDP